MRRDQRLRTKRHLVLPQTGRAQALQETPLPGEPQGCAVRGGCCQSGVQGTNTTISKSSLGLKSYFRYWSNFSSSGRDFARALKPKREKSVLLP